MVHALSVKELTQFDLKAKVGNTKVQPYILTHEFIDRVFIYELFHSQLLTNFIDTEQL